jgi:hypothetical protein
MMRMSFVIDLVLDLGRTLIVLASHDDMTWNPSIVENPSMVGLKHVMNIRYEY